MKLIYNDADYLELDGPHALLCCPTASICDSDRSASATPKFQSPSCTYSDPLVRIELRISLSNMFDPERKPSCGSAAAAPPPKLHFATRWRTLTRRVVKKACVVQDVDAKNVLCTGRPTALCPCTKQFPKRHHKTIRNKLNMIADCM